MSQTAGMHRNAQSIRGGFVLVSLYSWAVVTLGIVITRFVRGLLIHKTAFGEDDATALAGHIIYIGTIVSWQYTVVAGLGKPSKEVGLKDVEHFSKAMYSAQLLEICAMTLAKFSSASLIQRIAPQSRRARLSLFATVGIWSIFSIFATAFRCGIRTDQAFSTKRCNSSGPLIAVIVSNQATDFILAAWLFPTFIRISLEKEKRFAAMVLFGLRAIVSLVAGVQIWAAIRAVRSHNPTHDAVGYVILSQAVTSLSLIAVNIPRIKQALGAGGSGIGYPRIQASELSTTCGTASVQTPGENALQLVPSGSGKFTATVTSMTSKISRAKSKSRVPPDWQGLVSLGIQGDGHTSTSSLFNRAEREGVMLERDFQVVVEDLNAPRNPRGTIKT
ncbi:hypothetical protein GQ44DRAFT_826452 [Phaeosphaeriaceae sp. PMI808]|nr:hypothetical protein GQ44DRAFT_826452 [Phaeosphaeriaceae sp. PMI808]